MECRSGCGACCIAPSIHSPIPGMPEGKLAGERCVQLNELNACRLFNRPERPAVCARFLPEPLVCGNNRAEALELITFLEQATQI